MWKRIKQWWKNRTALPKPMTAVEFHLRLSSLQNNKASHSHIQVASMLKDAMFQTYDQYHVYCYRSGISALSNEEYITPYLTKTT